MADRLIKSVLWLSGFTALGYGLLVISSPNEENVKKLKKTLPGIDPHPKDSLNKKEQFVNVLQAATNTDVPLYRLNKEGIEREIKKQ